MPRSVAHQRVRWCNRSIEWTAVAVDDEAADRNVVWSYCLDGLTFYSFCFDPEETGPTTRLRAVNWLNLHHLLTRREHLVERQSEPMR